MILDTSVLIDLLRGDSAALRKVRALEGRGVPLRIPTPAHFELWRGVHLAAQSPDQEARVRAIVGPYPSAAFDVAAAERAGEVDARLIRVGKQIDPEDAMIAGTALARGEPVLTRNVRHYTRIPGLEVEGY